SVRKWLTYMALVIAACVFIGDLIAALTYFLRGEMTSRFLAKTFVVLAISGGVFFYYYGGLRRSERSVTGGRRENALMAALSAMVVVVMLGFGFASIGGPSTQRMRRADQKRVQDLYQVTDKIHNFWISQHKLPEHLDALVDVPLADPITRLPYEYHLKAGS